MMLKRIRIVIKAWLNTRARSKIRAYMRGYLRLKREGRLTEINNIKAAFERVELQQVMKSGNWFWGKAYDERNKAVLQFILSRYCALPLHKGLLTAYSTPESQHSFSLPKEFRQILRENSVNVAEGKSRFSWTMIVLKAWVFGVFTGGKLLFLTLRGIGNKASSQNRQDYAFFDLLVASNLPNFNEDQKSFDLLSWYWRSRFRESSIEWVAHSVKNQLGEMPAAGGAPPTKYVEVAYAPLDRLWSTGVFLVGYFTLCAVSFARLIMGNWYQALLLGEAIKARYASLQDEKKLAKQYWFNNSQHLFRPLWTYEVEVKGSDIILYCYATNFSVFKEKGGKYPVQSGNWSLMTWPKYVVWDEGQKAFFERALGDRMDIAISGAIWFSDGPQRIPAFTVPPIAVFDVQPVRHSFYTTLGQGMEYYVPVVCNQFLIDLCEVCRQLEIPIAWKRKRNIASLAHPSYTNTTKSLLHDYPDLVEISPEISAHRVVNMSSAIISMPFSSTSLIGLESKKPSCFYDPSGLIDGHDRAAHNIEVISTKEDLALWIQNSRPW